MDGVVVAVIGLKFLFELRGFPSCEPYVTNYPIFENELINLGENPPIPTQQVLKATQLSIPSRPAKSEKSDSASFQPGK